MRYEVVDYEILDSRSFKKTGEILEDNERFLVITTVDYDLKVYKHIKVYDKISLYD